MYLLDVISLSLVDDQLIGMIDNQYKIVTPRLGRHLKSGACQSLFQEK